MQLRFSRAEYWLLEQVVEFTRPITSLVLENIEEHFNKPTHGCSRDELVETLEGLLLKGFISAHLSDDNSTPVRLSRRDEIEAVLNEPQSVPWGSPPRTYYGLTAEGGTAWEEFARPNWNKFVLHCCGEGSDYGPTTGEQATCVDRRRLERFLEMFCIAQGLIDVCSVQFSEVAPWEATYWKTLPSAHRVKFNWLPQRTTFDGEPVDGANLHQIPYLRNSLQHFQLVQMSTQGLLFSGFCLFRDDWYRWK